MLLRLDLALEVRGQTLGLLRVANLDLNVLEFPFQVVLEVVGPMVELVGLGIEEGLVAALGFGQGRCTWDRSALSI